VANRDAGASKTPGKHVRLYLTVVDHARLRVGAAKLGMSMAEFAKSSVLERLDETEGEVKS
jgi:hypothetical protein